MTIEQEQPNTIDSFGAELVDDPESAARYRRYRQRTIERTGAEPKPSKVKKLGKQAVTVVAALAATTGVVALGTKMNAASEHSDVSTLIHMHDSPSPSITQERLALGEPASPVPLAGAPPQETK